MLDRVVLPKSKFASSRGYFKEDVVRCIVDHVNVLIEVGYWNYDELPRILRDVYFSDYLMTEVLNGGFIQFFDNTQNRFNEFVDQSLEEELFSQYSALFKQAILAVKGSHKLVESELDKLDIKFFELDEVKSLTHLNYKRVKEREETCVELVGHAEYEEYIKSVTKEDPELGKRRERCAEELAERELQREQYDFWDEIAESFCLANEIEYLGLRSIDSVDFEGQERAVAYFCGGNEDEMEVFAVLLDDRDRLVFLDESLNELTREDDSESAT